MCSSIEASPGGGGGGGGGGAASVHPLLSKYRTIKASRSLQPDIQIIHFLVVIFWLSRLRNLKWVTK